LVVLLLAFLVSCSLGYAETKKHSGDIVCTQTVADESGQDYLCPPQEMLKIADSYLAAQASQKWDDFIPHVADDIVLDVLSAQGDIAQGKEAAVQLFYSLGKVMQSIDKVISGPKNWLRHDGVAAVFTKTQRSLAMNIAHNLTFVHMITFNKDCQVNDITEVADLLKTIDNFPLAFSNTAALYCKLLEKLCVGVTLGWGDQKDCYHYWMDAPQWVKEPETLKVLLYSKSMACLGKIVDTVESAPALAPVLCPQAGAPISGMLGCWQ